VAESALSAPVAAGLVGRETQAVLGATTPKLPTANCQLLSRRCLLSSAEQLRVLARPTLVHHPFCFCRHAVAGRVRPDSRVARSRPPAPSRRAAAHARPRKRANAPARFFTGTSEGPGPGARMAAGATLSSRMWSRIPISAASVTAAPCQGRDHASVGRRLPPRATAKDGHTQRVDSR
jgi:hypothetical protein